MKKLIMFLCLLLTLSTAKAQDIVGVVTGPVGSATDTIARMVLKRYDDIHGTTSIVINRPGGEGAIGMAYLRDLRASSKILFPFTGHMIGLAPADYAKWTAVMEITNTPFAVVCRGDFPANNWQEFVNHARSNPEKVSVGTNARPPVWPVLSDIERGHSIRTNWILYGGARRPELDMASGALDCAVTFPGSVNPALLTKTKIIAITASDASKNLNPSVDASMYRGKETGNYSLGTGAWVLADTDPALVTRLQQQFAAIISSAWADESFRKIGSQPGGSLANFDRDMKNKNQTWQRLRQELKITD